MKEDPRDVEAVRGMAENAGHSRLTVGALAARYEAGEVVLIRALALGFVDVIVQKVGD